MIDAYRTIGSPACARIQRKRSRFIAHLQPIMSLQAVDEALQGIRRTYHDASHFCFAYRLIGSAEPVSHADDGGEPPGSAGRAILRRLLEEDLVNVLGVVVRYFGGSKLGVGGLSRAYSDAIQTAMARARIVVHRVEVEVAVAFSPDLTANVMGAIHRHGAKVHQMAYDPDGHALITLSPSQVNGFFGTLREATGARATAEVRP
jgi:putative IMPACT (imprinted ancient) family translation regulator